jgi:hypothetical protein
MAESLGMKQPSVRKIKRRMDLHLATLRRAVKAAGRTLELRAGLPGAGTVVGQIGQASQRLACRLPPPKLSPHFPRVER